MAVLELKNLTKKFGDFTAVDRMDLRVEDGEMIALLGGSGCGKTTTLRMIAGFTEPFSGSILVDGKDVGEVPPYKRNVGIFFQNYALFPHMTVYENVAFGLKLQKLPKAETATAEATADVALLTKSFAETGNQKGLFEQIDTSVVTSLDNLYDFAKNEDSYGPSYSVCRYGIMYNADALEAAVSKNATMSEDLQTYLAFGEEAIGALKEFDETYITDNKDGWIDEFQRTVNID